MRSTRHPALYPQLITPFACAQWECLCRRSWTTAAARSRTVNLFVDLVVDDLEEVINTSKTRTDGARALQDSWNGEASTECKARLQRNLKYIIEHKEHWSIMHHVRSRLSHLARLACHLLAATLVRRPKVLTTSSPWCSKRPDPASHRGSSRGHAW